MKFKALFISLLFAHSFHSNAQQPTNAPYAFSKPPLLKEASAELPLGSVKAKGWLLKQLQLQAAGFTGHAEELYPGSGDLGPQSDWIGGDGNSWERVPYYVKGLVALAYTLNDPILIKRSQKWIDWTLNSQQENGFFGPRKLDDWWPRMPMLYALKTYFEATQDARVLPFLSKYFKYELNHLAAKPLFDWSKSRAGDNISVVLWLYNQTGDKDLLALADLLEKQAYPWKDIYTNNRFYHFGDDFHTKHAVSVGQALRFPALCYLKSGDEQYKKAFYQGIDHLIRDHGQPSGIASGTEFLAGRSSIQGVETCTVVEWMQSLEIAARILDDAAIGDRLEKIAFNQLPAQFSKDLKEHFYYTQPNQVRSKYGHNGFDEDYPEGLLLSPYSGMGCCRFNLHMGWPYFTKNSWAATADGGLKIIAYAPTEVSAFVSGNVPVKIIEETNYPFDEQIKLKVSLAKSAEFPLHLRVPAWCQKPSIQVNGKAMKNIRSGEMAVIRRSWKEGDEVIINFPMEVELKPEVNHSVSVERGPLLYALDMDAQYLAIKEHAVKGFFDYEVSPKNSWNYGLDLAGKNDVKQFVVKKFAMPDNPFQADSSPVRIQTKARKVANWGMSYNDISAFEVPYFPVALSDERDELVLIPAGSEKIRISCFPVFKDSSELKRSLKADFNDGKMYNWIYYGGGWFVEDGKIKNASNKGSWGAGIHGSKVVASGVYLKNFVFETDITSGTKGNAGVIFRVKDPAIGADFYEGYYVGINPELGRIEIGKAQDKSYTLLHSAPLKVSANKTYRLKVMALNNSIKVFLDGSNDPVVEVQDDTFNGGTIGLRSYDALPVYDNVAVRAL